MIVIAVVVGIALALCVAGWVPVVRDALRPEHVLPGPPVREAAQAVAAAAAAVVQEAREAGQAQVDSTPAVEPVSA